MSDVFPLSRAGQAVNNFGGSILEHVLVGVGQHFAYRDAAEAIRRILVEEVPDEEHRSVDEIASYLSERNRAWLFPKELVELGFPPALAEDAVGWQDPGYMDCFTLSDAKAWACATKGKPLDQVLREPEPKKAGVKLGQ